MQLKEFAGLTFETPLRYAYIDSKTALLSGAMEFHVADKIRPANDFFQIAGTALALQKKCYLKPKIDKM